MTVAGRQYLSFGGGVNSVALMLALIEHGEKFEAVFVNHGADYPETYEYVDMLRGKGYEITVIDGKLEGLYLYEYCLKRGVVPSIARRWCTSKFKVEPLVKYYKTPCIDLLGIDSGEAKRAVHRDRKGTTIDYPLIEWGIDRNGCEKIIKRHGLSMPKKSGCFFCPFARVGQVRELRNKYPDLWCKAKKLEKAAVSQQIKKGKRPYYIYRKSLDAMVHEGQADLFGERKPCRCHL